MKSPNNLSEKSDVKLVEGGIYITKREKKSYPYTVCKILHIGDSFVSVMMYRNCFKEFPTDLDISTLSIEFPTAKEDMEKILSGDADFRIGVGCVPLDRQNFVAQKPVLIAETNLEDWEHELCDSM